MNGDRKPADAHRRLVPRSITLRAFLVLFTIATVCLAWQTSIYNRQAREIRTIQNARGSVRCRCHDIRCAEGSVLVDYSFVGKTPVPEQFKYRFITNQKPAPKKWYPFDFKRRWEIVYARLPLRSFDDDMVAFLGTIPHLKYVEPFCLQEPPAGVHQDIQRLRAKLPGVELVGMTVGAVEYEARQRAEN